MCHVRSTELGSDAVRTPYDTTSGRGYVNSLSVLVHGTCSQSLWGRECVGGLHMTSVQVLGFRVRGEGLGSLGWELGLVAEDTLVVSPHAAQPSTLYYGPFIKSSGAGSKCLYTLRQHLDISHFQVSDESRVVRPCVP